MKKALPGRDSEKRRMLGVEPNPGTNGFSIRPGHETHPAWLHASAPLLFCLISACSSNPSVPERVEIPVLKSCVKEAPVMPQTTDETAIKAMDDYAATLVTWTERLLLKAYALKAEAVIGACK